MIAPSEPAVVFFGEKPPAVIDYLEAKDYGRITKTTFAQFQNKGSNGLSPGAYFSASPTSSRTITSKYKEYNLRSLISNIVRELDSWRQSGESIFYANAIKHQIDAHLDILTRDSDSRMLAGLLELLFENNNWAQLDDHALGVLRSEISRFADGNISPKSLSVFSKQVYRSKLKVFAENTDFQADEE
jgi:hypothetical protein